MIYDINVRNIKGEEVNLGVYKNKVLLIINTATKCGYTKQYDALQEMYEKYKEKGFEILDFPSNQFFNQAPGSIEDIQSFCELNFNTTFPLFDKIKVNGRNADPLFKFLKDELSEEYTIGKHDSDILETHTQKNIKWNFTKFLVDKNGKVVKRFSPQVKPHQIDKFVEELL